MIKVIKKWLTTCDADVSLARASYDTLACKVFTIYF
jgi:hypothetical protein